MQPVIGITPDTQTAKKQGKGKHRYYRLETEVLSSVNTAGGLPFILPVFQDLKSSSKALQRIDGLLISGGHFDIDPSFYGEKKRKETGTVKKERTSSEFFLLKAALKARKPVLGICGGAQLINVYFGGTLYQDILKDRKGSKNHEQGTHSDKTSHSVEVYKGTMLAQITGLKTFKVNSTHHQGVKEIGKGLITSAVSTDGIIEAIEKPYSGFVLGIQWHPEFLIRKSEQLKIFKSFIKASSGKAGRK